MVGAVPDIYKKGSVMYTTRDDMWMLVKIVVGAVIAGIAIALFLGTIVTLVLMVQEGWFVK